MKRLLSVVCAAVIGAAFVLGGPVGCGSQQAPSGSSGDVAYKCAMSSCTKTKTAKTGDAAPS